MSNGAPIVLGPPSFGSPDPRTSDNTLLPPTDVASIPMGPVGASAPVHSPLNGLKKEELVSLAEDLDVGGEEENLDGLTKDELVDRISPALDGMKKDDLSGLADLAGADLPAKATKDDIVSVLRGQPVGNTAVAPTMSVINDEATRHDQEAREGQTNPNR